MSGYQAAFTRLDDIQSLYASDIHIENCTPSNFGCVQIIDHFNNITLNNVTILNSIGAKGSAIYC